MRLPSLRVHQSLTYAPQAKQPRALRLPGRSRPSRRHICRRTPFHAIIHALKRSLHAQTRRHICAYPYKRSPSSMNAHSRYANANATTTYYLQEVEALNQQ